MTNSEIAESLSQMAEVYRSVGDETVLPVAPLSMHAVSKDDVIRAIRAIGGKFKKRTDWTDGYFMYYDSVRIPGVSIFISRDAVCRKIPARYECEPLLSPEDEAEILEVGA